ncbi:MAG: hypothetical protein M3P33_01595 [bacterium]|nr:hypothetical protein [bacterium]
MSEAAQSFPTYEDPKAILASQIHIMNQNYLEQGISIGDLAEATSIANSMPIAGEQIHNLIHGPASNIPEFYSNVLLNRALHTADWEKRHRIINTAIKVTSPHDTLRWNGYRGVPGSLMSKIRENASHWKTHISLELRHQITKLRKVQPPTQSKLLHSLLNQY